MTNLDQIKMLECSALVPYARNSRTHSEEQIGEIAMSIETFGMVGAIVVRDGIIAKGHGTMQAIKRLYASGKRLYPAPGKSRGAQPYPDGMVPIMDVSGWSDAQFRAFVIADNKIGTNSGWDDDILASEMHELKSEDFDLNVIGFGESELKNILFEEKIAPPTNYNNQSIREKLLIIVECENDAEQRAILDKLTRGGHVCRALTS